MLLPHHRFTVADDQHGIALPDFLERQWPEADRKHLRLLVQDGSVQVNRMDTLPARLKAGDLVEVELPDAGLPTARARRGPGIPEVLYSDPRLLVVAKPPGLPTVPDRGGRQPSVHALLAELRPGGDLRIVHRLDRDTSGCLALADGIEAARALDLEFREGRVAKRYLALVQGVVAREAFTVDKALGPDHRRPGLVRVAAAGAKGARAARTEVEVVERFGRHTLVRVHPRTGRGHQIRVHLAASHHPIVGDADYGGGEGLCLSDLKPGYKRRRGVVERPLLARMFLHAEHLEILSPHTGQRVAVGCPPPADLELALRKLRRFATDRGGS